MSKLVFTRHAKNRMRWRKIKKDEVEKAVRKPLLVKDALYGGKVIWSVAGRKFLRVTYVEEKEKIVIISAVYKNKIPKGG